MKPIDQAVKDAGGPSVIAEKLGISVQRLCNWIDRGVPLVSVRDFCLLVDVNPWDLRPLDWHRIWPELIGAEGAPDVPQPAEVRDAA